MADQAISYADLSYINSELRSIGSYISGISNEIGVISSKQDNLENDLVVLQSDLAKLTSLFNEFVDADTRHKALQLAETRVGNLRQELDLKFGYYAEVRRMAIGILQAVDVGIVNDNTLQFTTEEVMIKAPGYWLAPALVALASWIRDDRHNTENALNESLRRDDYKATLFYMLIMRRLGRNDASLKWLERYFMHQNPHNLSREFITILEAVITGVFPPAARQLMMSNVKDWLDLLTHTDNFVNQQKAQWVSFFEASGPLPEGKYPLLEKYCINWPTLTAALKAAKTHKVLQAYFQDIVSSTDFSKSVKVQLDEILSLLVVNFDDEELPLQEQVRLNQLIIQMDGSKSAAEAMMNSEKHIFEEKVDFLQLLTNASFNPQLAGATKATQTLAVSISQPWIVEAYDTFTAQSRNKIPKTIELTIEDFKTSTKDGGNENELVKSQELFYENTLRIELGRISFPWGAIIIGSLLCLGAISFVVAAPLAALVGVGIGGVIIWMSMKNYNKIKKAIIANVEERKHKAKEVLRGCIAETVDYRNELATEDANAEEVRHFIAAIRAEDFTSLSKETARNII